MKPKYILFITLLLALLAMLVTSCSSSKSISNKKETVDSVAHLYKDTFSVSKKETTKSETKDTSSKQETGETSNVSIQFWGTDTMNNATTPITIISRGDTTTIDAGGRKIKSVSVKASKTAKDSTGGTYSQTNGYNITDSNGSKQTSTVQLKKETTEKTKQKEGITFWGVVCFFWWLWVIILGYIVYRNRERIWGIKN